MSLEKQTYLEEVDEGLATEVIDEVFKETLQRDAVNLEAYRRTGFKSRRLPLAFNKEAYFRSLGEEPIIVSDAGYYYIYVKKEQPLEVIKENVEKN